MEKVRPDVPDAPVQTGDADASALVPTTALLAPGQASLVPAQPTQMMGFERLGSVEHAARRQRGEGAQAEIDTYHLVGGRGRLAGPCRHLKEDGDEPSVSIGAHRGRDDPSLKARGFVDTHGSDDRDDDMAFRESDLHYLEGGRLAVLGLEDGSSCDSALKSAKCLVQMAEWLVIGSGRDVPQEGELRRNQGNESLLALHPVGFSSCLQDAVEMFESPIICETGTASRLGEQHPLARSRIQGDNMPAMRHMGSYTPIQSYVNRVYWS